VKWTLLIGGKFFPSLSVMCVTTATTSLKDDNPLPVHGCPLQSLALEATFSAETCLYLANNSIKYKDKVLSEKTAGPCKGDSRVTTLLYNID
jgi:hypothetical protein